jgi:hypothetical protein
MVLLGCKPKHRLTEQHDIFFGIANSLKELSSQFYNFWPEGKKNLHVDAWREVTSIDGYSVKIGTKTSAEVETTPKKIFFMNLGGYQKNEFEELHFKLLVVAENISEAIKTAKQHSFYKNGGFKGAAAHIDDKYALDVDEIYLLEDVLSAEEKQKYSVQISVAETIADEIHLGYLPVWKIKE